MIVMLEAHTNLGECLQLLYGESAFKIYTNEVAKTLAQSGQLKFKIESLQSNVKRLSEQASTQIKELKVAASSRQNSRVFYDHYRGKVSKLEKTHASSGEDKKQQMYQRNIKKYNEARAKFDQDNSKVARLLELVQIKIDVILSDICFKFTQEVEVRFFTEMNTVYSSLQGFEERMREIALQAASGNYGKVGNKAGLDLNVQF